MRNNRQSGATDTALLTLLYERLSRDDGDKAESDSIAHQRELLEGYAEKHGMKPFLHVSDDGYSGTNWSRPGWQEVIARIEAGEVLALVVKDSTRIGRDYIRVGALREFFKEKNVRLIAINDNFDSFNGDDDFTPFRDVMSEWYARDASRKIRSVIKTNGEKGKRLTNVPIYGFRLDPDDKTKWVIDDDAAAIVRRIFEMTIEGKGPQQIAKTLCAEKVERSSYYMTKRGLVDYSRFSAEETKYDWNTKTISVMLAKPEYKGSTVNFRTTKESYKDKRRSKAPKEDWMIFEDTHPAIVSAEVWELAQKCRETKRRPSPNLLGESNPLTGLVHCADCGAKMYNHREAKTGKTYYHKQIGKSYERSARDTYHCSNYSRNAVTSRINCTQHFIRTETLRALILETIKSACGYVKDNEAEFVRKLREASEIRQEAEAKTQRGQLAKNRKRRDELDTVISKLFEQSATGRITESRFDSLLAGYEKEQAELTESIAILQSEVDSFDSDSDRAERFIEIVKRCTDITELTTPMINEFIDKIVVHEADRSSGQREQKVDIYLTFIGRYAIEQPEPTQEEIEAMEKLQRQRERKRNNTRRWYEKRKQEMAEQESEAAKDTAETAA